jgi:hypothetical protein
MKHGIQSILISLACLVSTTAFAVSASAGERSLLLKGTIDTVETHVVHFPTFDISIHGIGHATLLGQFTSSGTGTIDIPTRTAVGVGSAQFTAANGDQIFAVVTGNGTPIAGTNLLAIVENYTITGGTGRFAGATGSIRLERVLDTVLTTSSGTFEGTVILP